MSQTHRRNMSPGSAHRANAGMGRAPWQNRRMAGAKPRSVHGGPKPTAPRRTNRRWSRTRLHPGRSASAKELGGTCVAPASQMAKVTDKDGGESLLRLVLRRAANGVVRCDWQLVGREPRKPHHILIGHWTLGMVGISQGSRSVFAG